MTGTPRAVTAFATEQNQRSPIVTDYPARTAGGSSTGGQPMTDEQMPSARWFAETAETNGLVFIILRVHPDLAYEYVSDGVRERLGISAEEILRDPDSIQRLLDSENREIFQRALTTSPGEQLTVELKWSHGTTGRPVYTRCSGRMRRREDGSTVLEGSVVEITDLREAEAELRHSEGRHRLLVDNSWDVIWTMDPDGNLAYLSTEIVDLHGVTSREAIDHRLQAARRLSGDALQHAETHPLIGTVPAETAARLREYFTALFGAIRTGGQPPRFDGEVVFYAADGSERDRHLKIVPHVGDDGSVLEIVGVSRDISERRRFEDEIRRSEQRYRLLADKAWEVTWIARVDGTVIYCSPAILQQRGFTPEEVTRQRIDEIFPPDSAAKVKAYAQALGAAIREGAPPPSYREELELFRRDGSVFAGEVQVIPHVDADGRVVEILGVTRDISERKRYEAELTRLAGTDPLTGVWNRRHGEKLLDSDFDSVHRWNGSACLLMVDIDHFKSINDSYGHQVGDSVLSEIARRLRAGLRGTDVLARWGGDEFVVLLRHCNLDGARMSAENLRRRIAATQFPDVGTVSVSIGAAQATTGESVGSLLARADAALYEAKRAGRNAVHT